MINSTLLVLKVNPYPNNFLDIILSGSSSAALSPGADSHISTSTTIKFSITPNSKLRKEAEISITIPNKFTLPPDSSDLSIISVGGVGKSVTRVSANQIKLSDVITVDFLNIAPVSPLVIEVSGIITPIVTYTEDYDWEVATSLEGAAVHQGTIKMTGQTFTEGQLNSITVTPTNTMNLETTDYTFVFTNDKLIPSNSVLKLFFPSADYDAPKLANAKGGTLNIVPTGVNIEITNYFTADVPAGTENTLKIEDIINPRLQGKKTDQFDLQIYLTTESLKVSSGICTSGVTMTLTNTFSQFQISISNVENLATADYTFQLTAKTKLLLDDRIYLTVPPSFSCTFNFVAVNELVIKSQESQYFILNQEIAENTPFSFKIECENPPTTAETENFGMLAKVYCVIDSCEIYKEQNTTHTSKGAPFKSIVLSNSNEIPHNTTVLNFNVERNSVFQFSKLEIKPNANINIPSTAWDNANCEDMMGLAGSSMVCTKDAGKLVWDGIEEVESIFIFRIKTLQNPKLILSKANFTLISYTSTDAKVEEGESNEITVLCNTPCRTCESGQGDSCTSCFSVADGTKFGVAEYFLNTVDKKCLLECPTGWVDKSYSCYPCDETDPAFCATCEVEVDQCKSCVVGKVLQGTKCLGGCDTGYYNVTNVCVKCDDNCKECEGNPTNCTECNLGSGFTYFYENKCYNTCPEDTYSHVEPSGSKNCSKCSAPDNCASCYGTASNCTSCIATPDKHYLVQGQNKCVTDCTTEVQFPIQFGDACVSCQSPCPVGKCSVVATNCTSCVGTSPARFLESESCVEQCADKYWENTGTSYCDNCNTNCRTCEGNKDTCITCDNQGQAGCSSCENLYLNTNTKTCQTDSPTLGCPHNFLKDKISNPLTWVCEPCATQCDECEDSTTKCTKCDPTSTPYAILFGNTCVTSCNPHYFNSSNECIECNADCKTCSNKKEDCDQCYDGKFLNAKKCIAPCPSGMWGDPTNNECKPCTSPCSECEGSAILCTKCVGTQKLYLGTCHSPCPNKTVLVVDADAADGLQDTCDPCPANCDICDSKTICSQCTSGAKKYNNLCYDPCPEDTFESGSICVTPTCPTHSYPNMVTRKCIECNADCKECEGGGNICTECTEGKILHQTQCMGQCPNGTLEVVKSGKPACINCIKGCDMCTKVADNCTKCSEDFYMLNSTCYGACPTGYESQKETMSCVLPTPVEEEKEKEKETVDNTTEPVAEEEEEAVTPTVVEPTVIKESSKEDEYGIPPAYFTAGTLIALAITFLGRIRNENSLIRSNFIILLSYVFLGAVAYLCLLLLDHDSDTTIYTLYAMLGGTFVFFFINWVFLCSYCSKVRKDPGYHEWTESHCCLGCFIPTFSTLFSFHTYRLLYSRFFGCTRFFAGMDNYALLFESLDMASYFYILLSLFPIFLGGIFGFFEMSTSQAIFITTMEVVLIALLLAILLIFEVLNKPELVPVLQPELTEYSQMPLKESSIEDFRKKVMDDILKTMNSQRPKGWEDEEDYTFPFPEPLRRRAMSISPEGEGGVAGEKVNKSYPASPSTVMEISKRPTLQNIIDIRGPYFDNILYESRTVSPFKKSVPQQEYCVQTPPFDIQFLRQVMREERQKEKIRALQNASLDGPELCGIIMMNEEEGPLTHKRFKEKTMSETVKEAPQSMMEYQHSGDKYSPQKRVTKKGELMDKKFNWRPRSKGVGKGKRRKSTGRGAKRSPRPGMKNNQSAKDGLMVGGVLVLNQKDKGKNPHPVLLQTLPVKKASKTSSIEGGNYSPPLFEEEKVAGDRLLPTHSTRPLSLREQTSPLGLDLLTQGEKDEIATASMVHPVIGRISRPGDSDSMVQGEPDAGMIDDAEIMGDFDVEDGIMTILKGEDGSLLDKVGRKVNKQGYLLDTEGNVINKNGEVKIRKDDLVSESELDDPQFKGEKYPEEGGLAASMLDMVKVLEKKKRQEDANTSMRQQPPVEEKYDKWEMGSEASRHSEVPPGMEETPSNFNDFNTRKDEVLAKAMRPKHPKSHIKHNASAEIIEDHKESDEAADASRPVMRKKRKKSKKKRKHRDSMEERIDKFDKQKMDKEKDRLFKLTNQLTGYHLPESQSVAMDFSNRMTDEAEEEVAAVPTDPQIITSRSFIDDLSKRNKGFRVPPGPRFDSVGRPPHPPHASALLAQPQPHSDANDPLQRVYGMKMEEFLEDSRFDDLEQFSVQSSASKNLATLPKTFDNPRIKEMKKLYLQRLGGPEMSARPTNPKRKKRAAGSPRQKLIDDLLSGTEDEEIKGQIESNFQDMLDANFEQRHPGQMHRHLVGGGKSVPPKKRNKSEEPGFRSKLGKQKAKDGWFN